MAEPQGASQGQTSLAGDSNVQDSGRDNKKKNQGEDGNEGGNLTDKMQSTYGSDSGDTGGVRRRNAPTTASDKRPPKDVLVASAVNNVSELPLPNEKGAVGAVPVETIHPDKARSMPKRDVNKFDTSIDTSVRDRELLNSDREKYKKMLDSQSADMLFPWTRIGEFHPTGKGSPNIKDTKAMKDYISENLYNDWYYNAAIIVGTCFFAWLFAYGGFSWWALCFVFFCSSSVYGAEYYRFNRNIRDDLTRITVQETLSDRTETTLWLNTFLSKFWVIYMPVLSQQVKDAVNPLLSDAAPGYGIEALSLDHFTLGTKAPAIRGIKSNTKAGKDTVEMEWSFAFTPNDVSEMTPKEAKEKINPKIVLGVTLGKSFVSKTMSVITEDINVAGRLRVAIKFGSVFPNIKIVSIQLLEPPLIDFVLKPVGGDTLGLDVMSFLPGLKSFVKAMINSNVGPMLYAPNKMDIDVEEIVAAQSNDAIGVVAVTIISASDLKGSDFIGNTVDPYVVIKTEKDVPGAPSEARTSVKSDVRDPRWRETKFILVNSMEQKLSLKCFDFNDVRRDTIIGEVDVDLKDLIQNPSLEGVTSDLKQGNKTKGALTYSLRWFPVIGKKDDDEKEEEDNEAKVGAATGDEDFSEEEEENADVGIFKINLQRIRDLPLASSISGTLSPSAELYIDNKLVKKFRTLKKINEPAWDETLELFLPSKSTSRLHLKVFDVLANRKELLCEYDSTVEEILNMLELGRQSVIANPQGEVYFAAHWKPVQVTGSFAATTQTKDPLGFVKLHVRDAAVKSDLSGVGDIDPYFTVSINKHVAFRSKYFSETTSPIFNSMVYLPIMGENQLISLALYDYQNIGKDRHIGSVQIMSTELIKKDSDGNYLPMNKANEVIKYQLRDNKNRQTPDYINISRSFIPTLTVFSPDELESIKKLQAELKEKRQKFEAEQAKLKQEMEQNPDEWEVVDIKDPFEDDERKINAKHQFTLEELLQKKSGILMMQILGGKLAKASSYLHILFDDFEYPSFVSTRSKNYTLSSDYDYALIRDLDHSKIIFRISKARVTKNRDDVVSEKSFSTIDLLRKGYKDPIKVNVNGSDVQIRFFYSPSAVELPPTESITDTGNLHLDVVSADNLISKDRNGKSDPFVEVYVDNKKVYKSPVIKRNLSPVWNDKAAVVVHSRSKCEVVARVYDWDRAGDNDFLGEAVLDVASMKPGQTYDWNLDLDTQGSLKLRGTFAPEYIRPDVEISQGKLSTKPLKAVGNVAGAGIGVATGGLHLGGKILKKGLTADFSRKSKNEPEDSRKGSASSNNDEIERGNMEDGYDPSEPDMSYAPVPVNSLSKAAEPSNGQNNAEVTVNDEQGDERSRTTSQASSFGRSSSANGAYRGTIRILGAEKLAKNVQVRVSLAHGGKMKLLHKTKSVKANEEGVAIIKESCPFKAAPGANLVFGAASVHKLSKDRDLGVAQINLCDPQIHQEGNIAIKLGEGHIIVKIEYAADNQRSAPPAPHESR